MRFMVLRKADEKTEAGVLPSTELLEAMGKFMEESVRAGVFLGGEGLQPSAKGALLRRRGGRDTIVDGPFTEAKELVAGYGIIQVGSKEEAIEWLKRWPREDGDIDLELRPIMEAEDLGENFTPEQREREDRLRAEIESRA